MLGTILIAAIPLLALLLVHKLRYYRTKQYADFPQLPPSLLWGHLKALREVIESSKPNLHFDHIMSKIAKGLGNPPLFLLDPRPASYAMAVICSHEVAEQVSKSSKDFPYSVTKSPTTRSFIDLMGPTSIVLADGEEWKSLRKRFNPGFAHQHLISLLPCILDKTWPFLANLDHYAQTGEDFQLDGLCTNLTFDIIGAVTMDIDMDAQFGEQRQGRLSHLYRELGLTYRDGRRGRSWFSLLTIRRTRRRLSKELDALIKDRVRQKYAEMQITSNGDSTMPKTRSVLSLSLKETSDLTPHIIDQTCDQLKSFLFAGHDTTSILLQWAFYELSRTPRALRSTCAELDEVFGSDASPSVVREKLLANGEELLQRLSYISAVIKETLRLYPPAGTARYPPPGSGFNIRLPDGRDLCLDGVVLYNCATIIQRDEAVYGETKDEFVPERWLGNTDKGASVPPSAWRPFERGPRHCIGQELANIEARVILACAVRRYDWTKVGLGEFERDTSGDPVLKPNGQYEVKSEVYNTIQITAKPVDGMKMRVRLTDGQLPL